jgi:DNA polymerase elongation subunit (family B)
MFGDAYNLSYTDIYDFSSKKQSLKKFEIELGIHHQELGLEWDKPVKEELWKTVAEYCANDVLATEAVFKAREADFLAREILAEIAGGTVNDTTNTLTTRLIFGKNRKPQDEFNYRNLAEPVKELDPHVREFLEKECGLPIPFDDKSLLPYFKGYKYENGVSTYRGFTVGEGGFVYSEPGAYSNVALLDVASDHPHSITNECLFGVKYTRAFKDLMDTRILVKHKAFDAARKMFDGKLARFLDDEAKAKMLAQALKIAINSVYGLTAAKFDNPFRDMRNKDNIVAKRGALFMIDLLFAVREKGFKAAHIKTDSIKIPNATPEIIQFVIDFGKRYGYDFEHEATYERMCLVNDAVYIARYSDGEHEFKLSTGEKLMTDWTATGTQFQVPFLFKTLFSKHNINFSDMCETKNVKTAMYLDMNEGLPEGEHNYKFVGRTGLYCPVKEGVGGGRLVRINGEKYDAVVGTKGYRWMEAETVKTLGMEDAIDISYYSSLVDSAIETIKQYVVSVDDFCNSEIGDDCWKFPF